MHKPFSRSERVAGLLRRQLPVLLRDTIKDPRVAQCTVTDVVVSRDLSYAEVYVMSSDSSHSVELLKGLKSATGYLHRELKAQLTMRAVPELRFHYDRAADDGARIDMLLNQANAEAAAQEKHES